MPDEEKIIGHGISISFVGCFKFAVEGCREAVLFFLYPIHSRR